MSLILLNNISKTYLGDGFETKALVDVSFSVERGEFVAIMGPSGSGKSTLLHILGLLDRHTGGSYFLDGRDVSALTDQELAHFRNETLGFVFQSFNLLSKETVYENVKLPLLYSSVPVKEWNDRIVKAIEDVRLTHRKDFTVSKLSGGEKQRVAIARALVCEPNVLFADEPTGNLDSVSGEQIMKILRELHEAGKTIMLITHEHGTAAYAERILRIKDGAFVGDEKVVDRNMGGAIK